MRPPGRQTPPLRPTFSATHTGNHRERPSPRSLTTTDWRGAVRRSPSGPGQHLGKATPHPPPSSRASWGAAGTRTRAVDRPSPSPGPRVAGEAAGFLSLRLSSVGHARVGLANHPAAPRTPTPPDTPPGPTDEKHLRRTGPQTGVPRVRRCRAGWERARDPQLNKSRGIPHPSAHGT